MPHSPVFASKLGIGITPPASGNLDVLNNLQTGDGTSGAGEKAIGFRSENTGWSLPLAGLMRLEIGGFLCADYSSTQLNVEAPNLRIRNGTAALPSFNFNSSKTTGMYRPAADIIGFVTAATEVMRMDASQNLRIGTGTNNITFDNTGAMTLTGSSRVIKEIHIDVGSMSLVAGSVPALGLSGSSPLLLFDDTTVENANMSLIVPGDADLTVNPVMRIVIAPGATQSVGSDFATQLILRYLADGELLTKAVDETLNSVTTVSNTAATMKIFDVTLDGSLMTIGDCISMGFGRAATSGSDDRNGDMGLLQIVFRYTSNKIGG